MTRRAALLPRADAGFPGACPKVTLTRPWLLPSSPGLAASVNDHPPYLAPMRQGPYRRPARAAWPADPGCWMTHCHNVYHAESAMMAAVGYLR